MNAYTLNIVLHPTPFGDESRGAELPTKTQGQG